ncbi:hypothetical protein [Acuticoccus kandeliae]|uniref:hypothetical protein n=1 Tax=Acuticoccus kandeliae TaxID=2073160 RepID=UPI000D3EB121|nr:hypothetical protein [Acuticoccus kandeliae]
MRVRAHHGPAPMHTAGAWPFVTFRSFHHRGRHITWRAREHRKGLRRAARALENAAVPFWQAARYNWITGAFFAVGALLFMLGAGLSLVPDIGATLSGAAIAMIYFAGSVPFTIAGYLQHFQAANAPEFTPDPEPQTPATRRIAVIGWHPGNAGWISTITQFIGTIAFNFNTFDSIDAPSSWWMQDLAIWTPGMVGSVLFLVSGTLAFIETGHAYWSWKPRDLSWWIVFVNLIGCVAFMISSILAFVPKGAEPGWIPAMSNAQLFAGALGFLIGALLMMRESRLADAGGSTAAGTAEAAREAA